MFVHKCIFWNIYIMYNNKVILLNSVLWHSACLFYFLLCKFKKKLFYVTVLYTIYTQSLYTIIIHSVSIHYTHSLCTLYTHSLRTLYTQSSYTIYTQSSYTIYTQSSYTIYTQSLYTIFTQSLYYRLSHWHLTQNRLKQHYIETWEL